MQVQRSFSLSEVYCPCGHCTPVLDSIFIDRLQVLRDIFGKPLIINSWYRCEEYNKKIGGVENSQHLLGLAVDISTEGWSASERFELLELAFRLGFTGIAQGDSFIHLDLRKDKKSTWTY